MADFYADEDIPASLVAALTALGHDVLTAANDGKANQQVPDADVLARAAALKRVVLTYNRRDFHRLHKTSSAHQGIVICTDDPDRPALAARIDQAVRLLANFAGQLIRIVRPNRP